MHGGPHNYHKTQTNMTIRTFNEEGVRRFRDWLDIAKGGGSSPKPDYLLTDPALSEPLVGAVDVSVGTFANRYQLALHVDAALINIPIQQLPMTHGVWSWLSLFFMDVLCPPRADGTRSVKELVKYIPTTDYQKYYRHLIGFGVHAIRKLGPDAEPLLVSTKPGILHTDYCEHVFGYQDLCQTRTFISVANALYFDQTERKIKRGATPNKKKAGTLRRLVDVFYQLDLTYDVQGMGKYAFQNLLPPEFQPWLTQAPSGAEM
jgi:hypothetical protein